VRVATSAGMICCSRLNSMPSGRAQKPKNHSSRQRFTSRQRYQAWVASPELETVPVR
jgi:hypothetical protein